MPASRKKPALTHLDPRGRARMVDVSDKPPTRRRAVAQAELRLNAATWKALRAGNLPKGDALAVARIAGIQAAKRAAELIPLCHPLSIDAVHVDVLADQPGRVRITAEVVTRGPTGVEMEALTAAAVAALAVYDMCKSMQRGITIGPIRLTQKSGGRSGDWSRPAD